MQFSSNFKSYTGVGSRETPAPILSLMSKLAYRLAEEGWTLRSGGADGADTAFEEGASDSYGEPSRSARMEIYLPWNGFNGHEELDYRDAYQNASKYQNWKVAQEIASTVHPVWDRLKPGAKALHTRNVYQVLGKRLDDPSSFLVCWAKPTLTGVAGGTNTAVKLAERYGVKVFNLYIPEHLDRIKKFLSMED